MTYFREKMRALRREYTKRDRKQIIAAAGNKCSMCDRVAGDEFLFGPTHYLKRKLRFKVVMDIHVIEGSSLGANIVICNGCHISYHLFNRLSEDADFGNKTLSETHYRRCNTCKELNCMCCARCSASQKWCTCNATKKKTTKRTKKKAKKKVSKSRKKV